MEIRVSTEQGRVPVTVFRVFGDVDVQSYEALQAQAEQAYRAGTRYLLLDLAQVDYVSSAGIRAINHLFNLMRTDVPAENDAALREGLSAGTFMSQHLKLLNPNPRVKEVLKITGLDMFLEFHTDLGPAVASF